MKRLIFVTSNTQLPWGGSEVLWSRCASHMALGAEATVGALLRYWEPVPLHVSEMAAAGVEVVYRPEPDRRRRMPRHQALLNRLLPCKWQFCLTSSPHALSPILDYKPELVVQSCGNHAGVLPVAEFCLNHDIPYINIIQLVSEVHYTEDDITDRLVKCYQKARLNCFVSRHNVDLAELMLGCRIPNLAMVRNPGIIKGKLLPYPDTSHGFRAACPGRLHSLHKGLDLLMDVLRQPKWQDRALTLSCFGEGPNRLQLGRLKTIWNLQSVQFPGTTDDILGVWSTHHIFVSASRMEAQPMSLVEAMACGRVPVATPVGSARELIENGVNGFLAEAATAHHLDQALERAWERRNDWEAMGKAAHKTAMEYLTPDPVEELADLILTEAGEGGPRSEIRGLRSEIRDPRSEVRGPRSEVRGPRSEV